MSEFIFPDESKFSGGTVTGSEGLGDESFDYDEFFKDFDMPSVAETINTGISAPTAFKVITSHMGERDGEEHEGLDIRARLGTPIMAFRDGIVRQVSRTFEKGKGPGKFVVIESPQTGELHKYFHLSEIDPNIEVGTQLSAGQSFGKAGNTGRSRGSHLHFEIHKADESGEYQPQSPLELYPDHFGEYTDKATGEPVNIDSILKLNTRIPSS